MPEANPAGAWQYLKDYGVVEALLAIFTIVLGVAAVFRANLDKKSGAGSEHSDAAFLKIGMSHDAINIITEIGREQNRILSRIEEKMQRTGHAQAEAVSALKIIEEAVKDNLHHQRNQTMLLEDLRNNQVMRGDSTKVISPRGEHR